MYYAKPRHNDEDRPDSSLRIEELLQGLLQREGRKLLYILK